MENKDEKIQQILDEYIKDVLPPQAAVFPALNILRTENQKRKKEKRIRSRRIAIAMACAAIFFCLIGYFATNILIKDAQTTQNYSLSQLSKRTISVSELDEIKSQKQITNQLFPRFDTGYDESLTLFYITDSAKPVLLLYKTRQMIDDKIAEIKILIELSNARYEDYAEYDYFDGKEFHGQLVKINTESVNGEYESTATLYKNDLKYYIDVVCPYEYAIDYVVDLIIKL